MEESSLFLKPLEQLVVDHQEEIGILITEEEVWERKTTGSWSNALKQHFVRLSFMKSVRHIEDRQTKPVYPVYYVLVKDEKGEKKNLVFIEDKNGIYEEK